MHSILITYMMLLTLISFNQMCMNMMFGSYLFHCEAQGIPFMAEWGTIYNLSFICFIIFLNISIGIEIT